MSTYYPLRATTYFLQRLLWVFLMCATLPLLTSCGSDRTIVHDLDERDANEILDLLSSKGISALKMKSEGGGAGGGNKATLWNINVPEKDASVAMSLLIQNGLPRRPSQNLLNIFANTGLVPSEMSEKIRYQTGIGEQLASTIRKIDGVLDASVQISFPEEDPLHPEAANKKKITSSVYVKYSPVLEDPTVHLVSKIKRLISAAVPGLDYDNVTVVLDRARFSDIQYGSAPSAEEEKHFSNIWSVIVAEESATRFRVIFFSFMILLLLLLLTMGWLFWKLHSVMADLGGWKALLGMHPLKLKKNDKEGGGEGKDDHDTTPPSSEESSSGGVT